MHTRKYVLSILVFVMVAVYSVTAAAEVKQVVVEAPEAASIMQVGVHVADAPFGGITLKRRVNEGLILQGTISLDDNSGSLSGRVLFDLGVKNRVFRYAGLGAGVGYMPVYDGLETTQGKLVGFEGFIGIDYPLEWFGRATPFSCSLEVVAQGVSKPEKGASKIVPNTTVDMGLSYWF